MNRVAKGWMCGLTLAVVVAGFAAAAQAGDIWVVGPSQKVMRNAKPPAASETFDPKTETVNLFAARNEFVAFQIVYAGDFKDVNVDAIEIKGPSPIANIELFREHYMAAPVVSQWNQNTRPFDVVKLDEAYKAASAPREFPDQMVPLKAKKYGAPFDVSAGANEVVWVDVFVPEDATAGEYAGTFKTAGQTFNIKLTVWNFALPSVSHFPQWAQTHPDNIAWGFNKPVAALGDIQAAHDAFYQMAHNHRLVLMEEWMWEGQVTKLKFDTYATGQGFTGPFGKGSGVEVIPVQGTGVGKLLDKGGYYNRAFGMTVDEPHGKDMYDKVRKVGGELKSGYGGKLRRFVTTQYDPPDETVGRLDDDIDIFCSASTPPEKIPELAKKGKTVWTYNEGYAGGPYIDAPGPASRTQAWAGFVTGSRCWYFWQACYWGDWQNNGTKWTLRSASQPAGLLGEIWNNPLTFDETRKKGYPARNALRLNGDGVLFYPGTEVGIDGPIASFRLKNLRQGGTDFEYLYLLEKMGKKDAALAEADKVLGKAKPYKTVTDTKTGTPKFVDYDPHGANWDAARIRLGKMLHAIGDKALREKVQPYNQYPNPAGSPDSFGGERY